MCSSKKHVKMNTTFTTMFVLVSSVGLSNIKQPTLSQMIGQNECVVGVFTTKELAIQGITAYSTTAHAGLVARIYQMLPDGDKQKRVKIYDGSFPLCAPKLSNEDLNTRIQKLEERLEAESNRLKFNNQRIQKLEEKLEAKAAECNHLKMDNNELTNLINRMKKLIQV
jgi:hypothetical protein